MILQIFREIAHKRAISLSFSTLMKTGANARKEVISMLKANGKYIDTLPVQQLLSQEENRADTVTIEVDRFHDTHDLSDFLFVMRGITESGGETETVLTKSVGEKTIQLTWEISAGFTQEAGTLSLDLFAYRYDTEDEAVPDYLLRYQLPPIQVRELPDGSHKLDEQSYTAFLLKVRETAEQAIEEITNVSGTIQSEIKRLDRVVEYVDTAVTEVITPEVAELREQTDELSFTVSRMTPIVILTEEAYQALEVKEENTLYVIRTEA